ncbi:WXG100 family type VII secretion target [Streptomyces sp. 8K308]|uniref:WXG100 family type VII secretion target n=1 Tax=Streptomyces sp. 8K308 TaxID=2530388 RepID=UPI001FB6C3A9|nr:WXG100 family type VII secretion target [Streptomyces sp. 8K308]
MADLDITYEDMRLASQRLKTEYTNMDAKLDELRTYIEGLIEDGYSARSGRAFGESFTEFTTGARQMLEGLDGMGDFLNTAADALEDTDTSLESGIRGG